MPSYPLTHFEIQKYYQNEPKFNGINSKINLLKIKDGVYVIDLDEYESTETDRVALYLNGNNVTYFDSFGIKHIPKENKKIIDNKNIITNVNRIKKIIQ